MNLTDQHQHIGKAFIDQARNLLANQYLPKIEICLKSLRVEDVWWRANFESNSIGNLMLHLSGNARQWIVSGLGGAPDRRERQAEFDAKSGPSKEQLLSGLKSTLAEADRVLEEFDTARLLDDYQIQGSEVKALEAIFHVVEHFSMHTGQIILLTKMQAKKDLALYDFSTGAPVHNWLESEQGS